jgi:hypothetical protein
MQRKTDTAFSVLESLILSRTDLLNDKGISLKKMEINIGYGHDVRAALIVLSLKVVPGH